MGSWHLEHPELLAEVRALVGRDAPTIIVVVTDRVVLKGPVLLAHPATGEYLDRWDIEVELPADYPNPESVPRVREVGGRIPWIADRHVFVDGSACLFVPEEAWRHYPAGMTITAFLDGPVRSYYLAQTHFELTGQWPSGHRSHHEQGRLEYWLEELKTADPMVVLRFLEYLGADRVNGHRPCYCGTGEPLRKCHGRTLVLFRGRISTELARESRAAVLRCLLFGPWGPFRP